MPCVSRFQDIARSRGWQTYLCTQFIALLLCVHRLYSEGALLSEPDNPSPVMHFFWPVMYFNVSKRAVFSPNVHHSSGFWSRNVPHSFQNVPHSFQNVPHSFQNLPHSFQNVHHRFTPLEWGLLTHTRLHTWLSLSIQESKCELSCCIDAGNSISDIATIRFGEKIDTIDRFTMSPWSWEALLYWAGELSLTLRWHESVRAIIDNI